VREKTGAMRKSYPGERDERVKKKMRQRTVKRIKRGT